MEQQPAAMDCPDEVADVVLDILKYAILSIRGAGDAGDTEYCRIQANHIHNLPYLLRHYRRERLEDYLKWGRAHYIRDMKEIPGANLGGLIPCGRGWKSSSRPSRGDRKDRRGTGEEGKDKPYPYVPNRCA